MVPWPPHGTMTTPKLSSASADELFHMFGHSATLGWHFCVPHHLVCMIFPLKVEAMGITSNIYDTLLEWKDPRVQTTKQSMRSESDQSLWVLSCSQIVWPLGSDIWDHVCVFSLSVMSDSVTLWTGAHQAPLSLGFSSQESWSGLPFPSPEVFLTQGLNLGLLLFRWILYHLSHQGSPPFETILVCLSQRISTAITW